MLSSLTSSAEWLPRRHLRTKIYHFRSDRESQEMGWGELIHTRTRTSRSATFSKRGIPLGRRPGFFNMYISSNKYETNIKRDTHGALKHSSFRNFVFYLLLSLMYSSAFITHRRFFQFLFRLHHFRCVQFISAAEDKKVGDEWFHLNCFRLGRMSQWKSTSAIVAVPNSFHIRRLTIHDILSFRFIFV